MPYRWSIPPTEPAATRDLHLWPNRSLPRRGFVWVIGVTAIGLVLPLLSVIGSTVMWGLLPFALLVIWALWAALNRSYRSGTTHEQLILSRDSLHLRRQDPGQEDRIWDTNPYWVRVKLHDDGPVDDYLTLTDGQREVEIGRFLSPQERQSLRHELERALAQLH